MATTKSDGPGKPETVICLFRVRKDKEDEFRALVERHWPTLHRLGLTTAEPSKVYRGADRSGGPLWVEIFTWKDGRAAHVAHEHPEVAAIWEPMETCVEERKGVAKWEFPNVQPVSLSHARA